MDTQKRRIDIDTEGPKLNKRTETEFIYRLELDQRTRDIAARDGIEWNVARAIAARWIADETGSSQLDLLPQTIKTRYYRVEYIRFNHSIAREYYTVEFKSGGKLHQWQSTNRVLAEIVRSDVDEDCKQVVRFYEFAPGSEV